MAQSADAVIARWKKGMLGAASKVKEGVMAMTSNPLEKAAQKKDKYLSGVIEAAESGKWEAGLRGVSFEDWKRKTGEIGSQRIAAGVEAATGKMQIFIPQLLAYTEQVKRQVDQMPDSTLEERIARSVATMRMMADFKPRKK